MTTETVPLSRISVGPEEFAAMREVLESGWLAPGDYNRRFEEKFTRLLGVKHAITMNSCTSALEVALLVNNVRGEVIVPGFTFVASANAVMTAGATPVFCDVKEASRNTTAEDIESRITPRTEAVMVVHYGGQPCEMDAIERLCDRHKLLLIEDSAETIGGTWNGRQAGSFGIGCFSFFPTKNITTGEGGMLTCNDDETATLARSFIGHGISSTTRDRTGSSAPWRRIAQIPGRNYRMSNLLAALGYCQMTRLNAMNEKRVRAAQRYDQLIAELAPIALPPAIMPGAASVYQMYTIQVPEEERDTILNKLRESNIGASVHFDPPAHLHPPYMPDGKPACSLPVTEKLARTLITLPMYPDIAQEQIEQVVACLKDAINGE